MNDEEKRQNDDTNAQHEQKTVQHDASYVSTCLDGHSTMNRQTNITTDHTLQNIIQFYEQNGFGTISGYVGEKIALWVNETSEEMVFMR
ncbi:hypothetical protein LR68_02792 [Anoxybacillus sp. BCO1]|nr:hypothetical protein LR68_02792 [Anoxybacillus sp. BCO1]